MPVYPTHGQGVPAILQTTPFITPFRARTLMAAPLVGLSMMAQPPPTTTTAAGMNSCAVTVIPLPVTFYPGRIDYFWRKR